MEPRFDIDKTSIFQLVARTNRLAAFVMPPSKPLTPQERADRVSSIELAERILKSGDLGRF